MISPLPVSLFYAIFQVVVGPKPSRKDRRSEKLEIMKLSLGYLGNLGLLQLQLQLYNSGSSSGSDLLPILTLAPTKKPGASELINAYVEEFRFKSADPARKSFF